MTTDTDTYSDIHRLDTLAIGESIIEPHIAARELHTAYKNSFRLAPKKFSWDSRTRDAYRNRLAIVTRVK